jgi:hypothetical protein
MPWLKVQAHRWRRRLGAIASFCELPVHSISTLLKLGAQTLLKQARDIANICARALLNPAILSLICFVKGLASGAVHFYCGSQ